MRPQIIQGVREKSSDRLLSETLGYEFKYSEAKVSCKNRRYGGLNKGGICLGVES
jgi:hypothetical protein